MHMQQLLRQSDTILRTNSFHLSHYYTKQNVSIQHFESKGQTFLYFSESQKPLNIVELVKMLKTAASSAL